MSRNDLPTLTQFASTLHQQPNAQQPKTVPMMHITTPIVCITAAPHPKSRLPLVIMFATTNGSFAERSATLLELACGKKVSTR